MSNVKNTDCCIICGILSVIILSCGAVLTAIVASIVLSAIVTGFNTLFVTSVAEAHIQTELGVAAHCTRTGEYTSLRAGSASLPEYAIVDCSSATNARFERAVAVSTTDREAFLLPTPEQKQCQQQWLRNMSQGQRDTDDPLSAECLEYLANR